jgi:hypothetical protein
MAWEKPYGLPCHRRACLFHQHGTGRAPGDGQPIGFGHFGVGQQSRRKRVWHGQKPWLSSDDRRRRVTCVIKDFATVNAANALLRADVQRQCGYATWLVSRNTVN